LKDTDTLCVRNIRDLPQNPCCSVAVKKESILSQKNSMNRCLHSSAARGGASDAGLVTMADTPLQGNSPVRVGLSWDFFDGCVKTDLDCAALLFDSRSRTHARTNARHARGREGRKERKHVCVCATG